MKRRGEKILTPVRANIGIRIAYRRKLLRFVDQMVVSYRHWIVARYRANPPAMAQDEPASKALERELRKLSKRWRKNFDDAANDLAEHFAKDVAERSSASLRAILKKGGWTVRFKMTRAMQDVLNATVAENVSLIRSIPQEFHTQIEGLVMRSVTAGRDLSTLSEELEARFKVPRRRAELIARDQNNKATAVFTRVRYQEMGIEYAIWLHSAGGKSPRKTHVANSGKRYKVSEGWFDPDPKVRKYIWPGFLINCKCVARPVVRGFT